VLRALAGVLADSARKIDVAARYGGEEFVLVLPETDAAGARIIAERLRKAVKKLSITIDDGRTLAVTMSLGVATYPDSARAQADLIACADAALYEAKRRGRDRVIHSDDMAPRAVHQA